MNKRQRSETFARYVGLSLKGRIITQGFTAKAIAEKMGRSPAAFNRWLNGKVEIPLSVFAEACEVIGVEPQHVIEDAYSRLCLEQGERDGRQYPEKDAKADYRYPGEDESALSNVIVGGFGQSSNDDDLDLPDNVETEWAGRYAADPKGDDPIDNS